MAAKKQNASRTKTPGKNKIKKVSVWSGLFRNFFTIISSLVSVVTLFILIRQNENTYRPDVEISANTPLFKIRYNDKPRECHDITFYRSADSAMESLSLRLVNLGMGAAKNIAVEWSMRTEKMLDTVSVGGYPVATGVRRDTKLNMIIFSNCLFQTSTISKLDFVLPVNQEKLPATLSLPREYLLLWGNLLARTSLATTQQDSCSRLLQAFVKSYSQFGMEIQYGDINRTPYRKPFILRILPKYLDLGSHEMVCSFDVYEASRLPLPAADISFSVLFPDRTLRTLRVE